MKRWEPTATDRTVLLLTFRKGLAASKVGRAEKKAMSYEDEGRAVDAMVTQLQLSGDMIAKDPAFRPEPPKSGP